MNLLLNERLGRRLERVLALLPESPAEAERLVLELGASTIREEAKLYGLSALLAHYLPQALPLSKEDALAARFRDQQIQSNTLRGLRALRAGNVEAIAFKGPALAARLYPASWLRPSTDVDLLIRPADVTRAREALEAAGWRYAFGPTQDPLDFFHDLSFVGPGRSLIELHFAPSWHFQARFDVEALFRRARRQPFGGEGVLVLSPADDLVATCVHAAAHVFEGVKWLFDLKLAASKPDLDWDEVIARAREAGVAAVTGTALAGATERVRAQVPPRVLHALGPGPVRQVLAQGIERIPLSLVRTRSYAFDLLLPDRLSKAWLQRLTAPPIKRARRAGRWISGRIRWGQRDR